MARIVGELGVEITADATGLAAQIRAEVEKAVAEASTKQIALSINSEQLAREIREGIAAAQATVGNLKVGVELDKTSAALLKANVKRLVDEIGETSPIEPKVNPKNARAEFAKFTKELSSNLSDVQGVASTVASSIFTVVSRVALLSTAAVGVSQLAVSLVQLSGAAGVLPGAIFAAVGAIAALKIGTQGFGQAVKDIGTDKFAADLAKLAPSARDTAVAISEIKPQLTQLRLDVQQQLFEGFGNSIRTLSGQLIPIFNTGLSGMATALNATAQQVVAFFSAASVKADLAETFNSAQISVSNLGAVLPAVLSILRDVTVVGSQAFAGLTSGAGAAAQRVADFVARARESGALANFIQDGINAFRELFQVIGNVISIVSTLVGTLGGGGVLPLLLTLTTTLRNFLNSAEGTAALQALGAAMQQIATSAGQVFLALLQAIGKLLADHAPDIAAFAKALGDDLVSAIQTLTPILSGLLDAIGAHPDLFANIAVGAVALAGALQIIVPIATAVAALIAAGTVGLVAAIVAAVVAAVVLIILNFDKIKAAIGAALDAIGSFFSFLGSTIADAFGSAVAFVEGIWNGVVSFFVGIGTAIGSVISNVISAIGQFFSDGFNAIVGFISGFISSVVNFFAALPGQIVTFIASIPGQVQAFIEQLAFGFGFVVGEILRFFIDLPANIVSAVVTLVDDFTAFTVEAGNALINGFTAGVNAVITFLTTFPGLALNAVVSLAQMIADWAVGVWNGALEFFTNGVNAVVSFVSGLPNQVIGAVVNLYNFIRVWADTTWQNAKASFVNGVNNVVDFVTGLPGQVVNAIGNLGSRLYQVGVDALNGLLNGLKSIASNILHWVSGLVGDILHGFTSGFDSHSPSRETYAIGQDVAAGLANALRDSRQLVADAAGDLAQAGLDGLDPILNPTVNSSAIATGISGAAGQLTTSAQSGVNYTVQQTNVMQQGTDVNQFADAVLKNGAAALASGTSLFGVSQLGVQAGVDPNFLAVTGV